MSSQLNAYIGRPKGKKDARSHLYQEVGGEPVRCCDWLGLDDGFNYSNGR